MFSDGDLIGGEGGLIRVNDHGGDVGVACGVVAGIDEGGVGGEMAVEESWGWGMGRVAAGWCFRAWGREEKGLLQCIAIGWCMNTPSDLGH